MSGDNGPTTEWLLPTDWYVKQFTTATPRELELWEQWTGDLPKREEATPYHSGPYSVRNFELLWHLGLYKMHVLEIGFCLGHSARAFLGVGATSVTSVENSCRPQTLQAAEIVSSTHPGLFRLIAGSSLNSEPLRAQISDRKYRLAYIDGDHSVEGVDADVNLCLSLGINNLWFDDLFGHWGPGTQPAIVKYGLKIKAILGMTVLTEAP